MQAYQIGLQSLENVLTSQTHSQLNALIDIDIYQIFYLILSTTAPIILSL